MFSPRTAYRALLALAMAWAVANCMYVYLFLGGGEAYRLESATLIAAGLMLPLIVSRGNSPAREVRSPSAATLAVAGAVLAIGWAAIFLPLVGFPFLSDDYGFLAAYRSIGDAAKPLQFYRPVFAVVFALLNRIGSGSPVPFHAVSFLLHLSSSAFVYLLAQRLLAVRGGALMAAAIFLFNPLQLEAVLWTSGLQDLLWTSFLLAALVCYVGSSTLSWWRIAATALSIASALWSKETAVCFVLLIAAVDLLMFRFRRGRLLLAAYMSFAIELTVYLILRHRAVAADETFLTAPSGYFIKQLLVIPYEAFVHPWNRAAVSVTPVMLFTSSMAMLLLFFVATARDLSRPSLAGPIIMFATTLPVYSLFYVSPELAGSRYIYFAAAGFGLFVVSCVASLTTDARLTLLATFVVAGLSAASLWANLAPWRTAGEIVESMANEVRQGRSTDSVVQEWQRRDAGLVMKDGRPQSYRGVWLLANGYPEFVARETPR